MTNSVESWGSLNESMGRGGQTFRSPTGKRQRIAFKIQSNTQFFIKIIRMNDVIDNRGNLTQGGASSVNNYINSQLGLVQKFGKLDTSFFKSKFIIYKVVRDTARVEKIQFTIANRSEYPEVGADYEYVSTAALVNVIDKNAMLKDVVVDTETKAATTTTDTEPEEIKDKTEAEAEGTADTAKAQGSKFRYTMRTNGKTYLMEFTADGAIDATVIKDKHPNGVVSWDESKPMWFTDADSAKQSEGLSKWVDANVPLYNDAELTNKVDVEFFTKMFTDPEYKNKIIADYEAEYGTSEITADNLRNMLYYKNDERIFPTEEESAVGDFKPEDSSIDGVVSDYTDKSQRMTF